MKKAKKMTDAQKYRSLKRQTEQAGMTVCEREDVGGLVVKSGTLVSRAKWYIDIVPSVQLWQTLILDLLPSHAQLATIQEV